MSETFRYRDGELHVEQVPLSRIADRYGTPTFVYSRAHMVAQYRALAAAFAGIPHQICYAVKANSNLGILSLFAQQGAGFDIVSGGELERVLRAGGDPRRTVFSGVGKSTAEVDLALKLDIQCFNVESTAELERIEARAALLGLCAPISVRVNPDIDANTHPYISTGLKQNKFGVPAADALDLYRHAARSPHLAVHGIDCHIGSLIREPTPMLEALARLLALADQLAAEEITLRHIDIGGGLGVPYRPGEPCFDVAAYANGVRRLMAGRHESLMLEPGRFLVANGGVLLTRVEYLKAASDPTGRNFAIVDAAMNDLIRPTLYQAYHHVDTVTERPGVTPARWDIVGPVCESADFLAHERELAIAPAALLAIHSAGAYGFVQSSNYNSRDRAAEVIVDGDEIRLVRARETISHQIALEHVPEWRAQEA
jgi:diaminopimelate decarboxylase